MVKRLQPARAGLLLIDWQERLFSAMPQDRREDARRRAGDLRWLATELGLPMLASEQYPKGLGATLPDLVLPETIEKLTFSALAEPAFAARLAQRLPIGDEPTSVLVSGMEAHICVAQTCRDLVEAGYEVWLVADAVLSRRELDWRLGVERARGDGASIVTSEAAMFELIGQAGTPLFREVSRRIR